MRTAVHNWNEQQTEEQTTPNHVVLPSSGKKLSLKPIVTAEGEIEGVPPQEATAKLGDVRASTSADVKSTTPGKSEPLDMELVAILKPPRQKRAPSIFQW